MALRPFRPRRRPSVTIALALALVAVSASQAMAQDQIYFPAVDNVTEILVQKIEAETVRVDLSAWYLTEHWISIALIKKYRSGVPVRLLGDRGSLFEIDPITKREFYWLASQGLPIRLRYYPTWYPEINHWKMSIFVGQNLVAFGSSNYTPFELAPVSTKDFKDETVLFTKDTDIVHAFKTKFDRFWNDTTPEADSLLSTPPYFKNWDDACATEFTGNCRDYATMYPNPEPMIINTARLEPDYPTDLPDMVWGQGPRFNDRLVQEINREANAVDFVIYRITVDNLTQALLSKHQSGVPVRIIMEPQEYLNRKWPEFWLTHANIDKLWAAGVPIKQRLHNGLTHMKMLVTSSYATNSSSNYAAAWQRDHDYFVPAATKPAIYQAMKNRFQTMWTSSDFADFVPQAPDAPTLASPAQDSSNVDTASPLIWSIAPFAVSYDVYLGTYQWNMPLVGNVPAQLVNSPPGTYSWTPPSALQPGTTYFWKVISRTNATPVNATLIGPSSISSFTTKAGAVTPPAAPATPNAPSPADGATVTGTAMTLTWTAAGATSYDVLLGPNDPPSQVAGGVTAASYTVSNLTPGALYFWQVVARNSGGVNQGPKWTFAVPRAAEPPAAPTSPNPAAGVTGTATNPTLTWAAAGATSYDVLFGTTNPQSRVATNLTGASYTPSGLTTNTTYFWQIVARNAAGATTGPAWSFTTASPPPPPAMLNTPSPANGAANVTIPPPTLTWSSAGAATYDVMFGTTNPPPPVATGRTSASYAPASLVGSTTYFWEIVAHNGTGTTTGPVWSFTTAAPPANANIVIYASDTASVALHGGWTTASDPTSPNGIKLVTPDNGWASTGAPPSTLADYIDVTFNANAGTPYTLWLRLQALARSKYNDAVWVQFSDALANGSAVYPLNSTSALLVNLATDAVAASLNGWGWCNGAYWLSQSTTIAFATSGTHTLRIQVREDGVQLDQIVLSPTTYLNAAPGPMTLDPTIVPKP